MSKFSKIPLNTIVLLNEKVREFQTQMHTKRFLVCDQDTAFIAGKLGFEIIVGPASTRYFDLELGSYISFTAYELIQQLKRDEFSKEKIFQKFLKSKKQQGFNPTLENIYILGGKPAMIKFLKLQVDEWRNNGKQS